MAGAHSTQLLQRPDGLAADLRDLLHDIVASDAREEADRLREALVLLAGLPEAGGASAAESDVSRPDVARIEALIAAGAAESAAFALVGEGAAFMLSRGARGVCLASRVMADGSDEICAEGATVGLALLAAHVSVLLATQEAGAQPEPVLGGTSARLH